MVKKVESIKIRSDLHAGTDKPKKSQSFMNTVLDSLQGPTDVLYNMVIDQKPHKKTY